MASRTTVFSLNVHVNDEIAHAEDEAVNPFHSCVKILIGEEGYTKYQILHFDGTGFYWRKIASKSPIDPKKKLKLPS